MAEKINKYYDARVGESFRQKLLTGSLSAHNVGNLNTGLWTSSPGFWLESYQKRSHIHTQSLEIVRILQEHQPDSRAGSDSDISLVCLCTSKKAIRICRWRGSQIIPAVASRKRQAFKQEFQYFHAHDIDKNEYRYLVLSNGNRLPLGDDLGQELEKFHLRIKNWARYSLEKWGIEILLRVTEIPVTNQGVNIHANIIFKPIVELDDKQWKAWKSYTHFKFPISQETGLIKKENVERVINYSLKINDLSYFARNGPDVIVWLAESVQGRKLVQPYNSFKAFRRQLEAEGMKIRSVAAPITARRVVTTRQMMPKTLMKVEKKVNRRGACLERDIQDEETQAFFDRQDREKAKKLKAEYEALPESKRPVKPKIMKLCGWMAPSNIDGPVAEPFAVVMNYQHEIITETDFRVHEAINDNRKYYQDLWIKNNGPDIAQYEELVQNYIKEGLEIYEINPAIPDIDDNDILESWGDDNSNLEYRHRKSEQTSEPINSPPTPSKNFYSNDVSILDFMAKYDKIQMGELTQQQFYNQFVEDYRRLKGVTTQREKDEALAVFEGSYRQAEVFQKTGTYEPLVA